MNWNKGDSRKKRGPTILSEGPPPSDLGASHEAISLKVPCPHGNAQCLEGAPVHVTRVSARPVIVLCECNTEQVLEVLCVEDGPEHLSLTVSTQRPCLVEKEGASIAGFGGSEDIW